MTETRQAAASKGVSAIEKLRAVETPTFRLLPVPNRKIDGWDPRVGIWVVA